MDINLQQGDCLELIKDIPDKKIDLIVTDPPYILTTAGGGGFIKTRKYIDEIESMKSGISIQVLDEMVRVMNKINIYLFCSRMQIPIFYQYFIAEKKCNWDLLEWHKTNPAPTCNNKYLSDTEYIFFAREKGVKVKGNYHTKHTYFVTPINQKEKKLYRHPTIKPTSIIDNLIINSCPKDGIVLDPFMGSDSTGVSAINQDCNFIGYELQPEYFEIAKERINNATKERDDKDAEKAV